MESLSQIYSWTHNTTHQLSNVMIINQKMKKIIKSVCTQIKVCTFFGAWMSCCIYIIDVVVVVASNARVN